ncbi:2,5-dioxovalerate dehydrogenase [Devosia soli]|uniref:2,5-dioxovalerate dehydrogenase n=1 Tax=Devosia soli TaxID=361041 RepID=A0A0F5L0E0_9HYPH|nr:aldehyde dehydrogenase (NADP(+)) [Devosia soli]KKB75843.1 2,5-dioxovalerate dehydrogenase [Devosia soli]
MSEKITGAALIGNADIAREEQSFLAFNPSTGEMLEPAFRISSAEDAARASSLAAAAFQPYRHLPYTQRATFLRAIAEEIMTLGDDLISRAMQETGLPEARIKTERTRTCWQLELFARVVERGDWLDLRVDTAQPDRAPLPKSAFHLRQIPLGPVAVFGSSNFPLAFSVAGGDTSSALAAGCPVIVKGHPAHPGTGELVARAVRKAAIRTNMPEGVFSYLPGEVATGTELVKNPAIKAVGFTGSRAGGMALVNLAASRPEPIPVYAEMSSINPVLLFPEALKRRPADLAKGYVGSLTQGAGQFCTNPGLVFVIDGPELSPFLSALAAEIGDHEPAVMLTKNIYGAFERGRDALQHSPGVTTIGESQPPNGPNRGRAAVFRTDFATFTQNPDLEREVFGASSLIVVCQDVGELERALAYIEGQLTATLQLEAEDIPLARSLMPTLELKAGRILANEWPTGVEVTDAMVHGGPYPATSAGATTSVGTLAIRRFLRPVSYQSLPAALLPNELQGEALSAHPHLLDGVVKSPG